MNLCHSGRKAFYGGKWMFPCPNSAIHHITGGEFVVQLCDKHFQEVLAAGLVTDPYLSEKEFIRRETERIG